MKGELSEETLVGAPATAVWSVYRGLELGMLVDKLLGHVVGKVEVIEGDGGVGTIVKLTFPGISIIHLIYVANMEMICIRN